MMTCESQAANCIGTEELAALGRTIMMQYGENRGPIEVSSDLGTLHFERKSVREVISQRLACLRDDLVKW